MVRMSAIAVLLLLASPLLAQDAELRALGEAYEAYLKAGTDLTRVQGRYDAEAAANAPGNVSPETRDRLRDARSAYIEAGRRMTEARIAYDKAVAEESDLCGDAPNSVLPDRSHYSVGDTVRVSYCAAGHDFETHLLTFRIATIGDPGVRPGGYTVQLAQKQDEFSFDDWGEPGDYLVQMEAMPREGGATAVIAQSRFTVRKPGWLEGRFRIDSGIFAGVEITFTWAEGSIAGVVTKATDESAARNVGVGRELFRGYRYRREGEAVGDCGTSFGDSLNYSYRRVWRKDAGKLLVYCPARLELVPAGN